jgi:hypothetical protein
MPSLEFRERLALGAELVLLLLFSVFAPVTKVALEIIGARPLKIQGVVIDA